MSTYNSETIPRRKTPYTVLATIHHLKDEENNYRAQIAEHIGLSKYSLGGLVTGLEDTELIKRHRKGNTVLYNIYWPGITDLFNALWQQQTGADTAFITGNQSQHLLQEYCREYFTRYTEGRTLQQMLVTDFYTGLKLYQDELPDPLQDVLQAIEDTGRTPDYGTAIEAAIAASERPE